MEHTQQPLVSIGIPIYNGEKYLAEAIDSVLAQEYQNFEIILCDNASSDQTEAICQAYQARDARIKYVRHPYNLLCTKNFLSTVQEARGKYFTWLACDDFISSPAYLQATVQYLETHPEAVLCGSSFTTFYAEDRNAKHVVQYEDLYEEKDWSRGRQRFFRFPITTDLLTYSMYRTEVLRKTTYLEKSPYHHGNYFPGVILLADLCRYGRMACLPEVLRSYRCNLDSLSYQTAYASSVVFNTKLAFLKIALKIQASPLAKLKLIKLSLANFLSFNRKNTSIKAEIKALRAEVVMLRKACAERLAIMETQAKKIEKLAR